MSTLGTLNALEVGIWLRILYPGGEMSARSARAILGLKIPSEEKRTLRLLMAKAKEGVLSPEEKSSLDAFERAGDMLAILQARARRVLRNKKAKA